MVSASMPMSLGHILTSLIFGISALDLVVIH